MQLPFDERERDSVRRDLANPDEEVRRLAVEQIEVLDDSEVLPRLVECLGDPDWRVRKAAVARIASQPDADAASELLIAALADGENPGRRNGAVEALVEIGERAVPALRGSCAAADVDVRKFAVDALGGIGSERATDVLIARLADPDPNVRASAADALGAIGGAAARQALCTAAIDATQEPLVRFSALHALDTLEEPLRAADLAGVLGDAMLGPAGLALLGRCEDDPGAPDALLKGLASEVRAARQSAMRAILRLAARLDGAALETLVGRVRELAAGTPHLVAAAIERLGDADLDTQLALVQFLGLVQEARAVVPILACGRDEALAQVAIVTLEEMGPAAVDALDEAWSGIDAERRGAACEVLGRIGGRRANERLIAALADPEPALRAAAARALGQLRVAEALPALVGRLELASAEDDLDEDGEQTAIIDAIVAVAGPGADGVSPPATPATIERLATRLPGASDATRLCVARVLGRIARREDAELVAMLLKDASAEVRRAAVDAIGRLEPDRTPEPLRLAIADESPNVRIAAAQALGGSRSDTVFDDLRRLAEDPDPRVRATAVRALGRRFGADAQPQVRAAALAVLNRACEDEAPVALAVVEAVNDIGGDATSYVTPLLGRAEPEVVLEAAQCLGTHAERDALEVLLPLVAHPEWSVRAEVIEILGERRFRQAVPAILRRLEAEQHDLVRRATLAALQRLEG